MKRLVPFIFTLLTATATAAQAQDFVDLRPLQTPLKNQGGRNTCITFAATAALEAAYKRAGYGDLDLSEEFITYFGKVFWIHPRWDEDDGPDPIGPAGPDQKENSYGANGGGSGFGTIKRLASGLRVPRETDFPYRSSTSLYFDMPSSSDPDYESQRRVDTFNFDARNLPFNALTASRYYTVRAYREINAKDPNAVEAALRAGYEVAWDFNVAGNRSGNVWQYDATRPSIGGHAMLIVGYDRRDPSNRYFIVKNSWGPTSVPGANGYTYISYGYLQYGYGAGYIQSVNTPTTWPELAAVGRWTLRYDGHLATLDIYHLPGQSQYIFDDYFPPGEVIDRRLGILHDSAGNVWRVNGFVSGTQLTFWFDAGEPNTRWDVEHDYASGQRIFQYTMLDGNREMAGWHELASDPTNVGGYARRDGSLTPVFNTSQAWAPAQFLGRWRLNQRTWPGTLTLSYRDDARLSIYERPYYAGLVGTFRPDGSTTDYPLVARVALNGSDIRLSLPISSSVSVLHLGRMLAHQRGVAAGEGFYMVRTGNP